jgi:hypothetical protein
MGIKRLRELSGRRRDVQIIVGGEMATFNLGRLSAADVERVHLLIPEPTPPKTTTPEGKPIWDSSDPEYMTKAMACAIQRAASKVAVMLGKDFFDSDDVVANGAALMGILSEGQLLELFRQGVKDELTPQMEERALVAVSPFAGTDQTQSKESGN